MKLYLLKCFWEHERHYFVLVPKDGNWDWINIDPNAKFKYYVRSHPDKQLAIKWAEDEGEVKEVRLDKRFPK